MLREENKSLFKDPLNAPFFKITDHDFWLGRQLVEGMGIFGSPGGGKTSIVGRLIALQLLERDVGFIVVTAKASEVLRWKKYAQRKGREKDLIIFSPESGLRFDPLFYEFSREGAGRKDIESVIEMLSILMSVGKVRGASHDPFWEEASQFLMRVLMVLLDAAGESISLVNMHKLCQSMPTMPIHPDDLDEWLDQEGNYCGQVIRKAEAQEKSFTAGQQADLDTATSYVLKSWPGMAAETRGSIEAQFSSMTGRLVFEPLRSVFSSGVCDFTPRDACRGKIIVVAYPMLQFGQATGALVNSIVKLSAQRDFLRRQVLPETPLTCMWLDECQLFLTPGSGAVSKDNLFQQSCRESKIIPVYITQNISNIAEAYGENQPGSKTNSFLGNIMLKFFLQNNDVATNKYAAELFGKEYRTLRTSGASGSNPSASETEHLLYKIDAHEFTALRKPEPGWFACDAVIYQGGQEFNATGTNYLRCALIGTKD
jgi:hypothetical protein